MELEDTRINGQSREVTAPPPLSSRDAAPDPVSQGYLGQAVPGVGVLQAARRYPLLVIVPMLLLAGLGVFVGMQRTATFTAQTRITVGRINLNAPGALAGFATATQALAAQFARAVEGSQVVDPVAKAIGIEPAKVQRRVSASPIPESPVFTIKATGPDEESAVRLANAMADQVVVYSRELNDRDPDASALLAEYKDTASTAASRQARVDYLRDRLGDPPSARQRRALAEAQASRDFWRLREQAVEQRYLAATSGETSSQLMQVLNRAETARSDESRWVQILAFAGLVGGLLLGLGLATMYANHVVRRRLSARP